MRNLNLPSHNLHVPISPRFSNSSRRRRIIGAQRVDYWPHQPRLNEKRAVCLPSHKNLLTLAYPIITAASSVESSEFPYRLAGNTGLFPSLCSRGNTFLLRFTGDDFENVAAQVDRTLGSEFDDILKDIDVLIGPEQVDDRSDGRDTPALDGRASPMLSPIVGSREDVRPTALRSEVQLPPLRPTSPPPHPKTPPTKKKNIMKRIMDKLKKPRQLWESLIARFSRGSQAPPILSNKLVPEREEEAKRYEPFFPESPELAVPRE